MIFMASAGFVENDMQAHPIHMPSLMADMSLRVRVTGETSSRIRIWLGSLFVKLAAFIMGMSVELSVDETSSKASAFAIPLRMSVHDAGYDWCLGMNLEVSLDGVEVLDVVAYDLEAGTIDRALRDESGMIAINPAGQSVSMETLRGDVQVTLKPF